MDLRSVEKIIKAINQGEHGGLAAPAIAMKFRRAGITLDQEDHLMEVYRNGNLIASLKCDDLLSRPLVWRLA